MLSWVAAQVASEKLHQLLKMEKEKCLALFLFSGSAVELFPPSIFWLGFFYFLHISVQMENVNHKKKVVELEGEVIKEAVWPAKYPAAYTSSRKNQGKIFSIICSVYMENMLNFREFGPVNLCKHFLFIQSGSMFWCNRKRTIRLKFTMRT